jgi:hypothetical protein
MNNEMDIMLWNELMVKLKQNYPVLTKSDLAMRQGSQKDLLNMISNKLGKPTRVMLEELERA